MKKEIRLTVGKLVFIVLIMLGFNIISSSAATSYAISANNIGYTDNSSIGADNIQAAIDGTCTKFSTKLNNMMEQIYPIGSIYISTSISDSDKVTSTLGVGKGEAYGEGKTLVGVDKSDSDFDTSGKTSGSKTVKLDSKNIPSITVSGTTGSTGSGYSIGHTCENRVTSTAGDHTHASTIGGSFLILGGSVSHAPASQGFAYNASSGWWVNHNKAIAGIASAGSHNHTATDCYASSISGVGAHTHTISASYSNTQQTEVNIMNPYITVYMYKRIS